MPTLFFLTEYLHSDCLELSSAGADTGLKTSSTQVIEE